MSATTGTPCPIRRIRAQVPVRICDIGGWTDTWFAVHGCVLHIAVSPLTHVDISAFPSSASNREILVEAVNFGETYRFEQAGHQLKVAEGFALIDGVLRTAAIPRDVSLHISVRSGVPPGCAAGTSASVAVALIGALAFLNGEILTPSNVARRAHEIETGVLHRQAGIQDQIGAAYGGINFIEMSSYPDATVEHIILPESLRSELESRLMLIYLGSAHRSTDVHELVMRRLQGGGSGSPELDALRQTAREAKNALVNADLDEFGKVMRRNTEIQSRLHPSLPGSAARAVIDAAKGFDISGWKVNGAGGEGGSMTLLVRDGVQRLKMVETITGMGVGFQDIPVKLAREGLMVREL